MKCGFSKIFQDSTSLKALYCYQVKSLLECTPVQWEFFTAVDSSRVEQRTKAIYEFHVLRPKI